MKKRRIAEIAFICIAVFFAFVFLYGLSDIFSYRFPSGFTKAGMIIFVGLWGMWSALEYTEIRRRDNEEKDNLILKFSRSGDSFPGDFEQFQTEYLHGDKYLGESFARDAIREAMNKSKDSMEE